MALPVPPYIQKAGIVDDQLLYEWDEWNVRKYYDLDPQDVWTRLQPLSLRAQIALSIAIGEWVCHRFSLVDADPRPWQFLEAAWAGVISPCYCRYTETDDDEWRGPARGPLNMTISIVNDALFHINEDPNAAARAVWMRSLARHVLPGTDAFDAWFDAILQRLVHSFPKPPPDQEDLFSRFPPGMGVPVPREAFDPARPYDPAQSPALLDAFLQTLDWRRNPSLFSPDEVRECDGFDGAPYRYA